MDFRPRLDSCVLKGTGHLWKLSKTSILSLVYPKICINNKSVNISWLNWSSKLCENNEQKTTMVGKNMCTFGCQIKALRPEVFYYLSGKLPLSHVTSKRAVSHNVLYNQRLSISRYQVSFYPNCYFEFEQYPLPLRAGYTFGNYSTISWREITDMVKSTGEPSIVRNQC